MARVEGVVVPAGGATDDPRLHPLDLRGMLQRAAFVLHDDTGAPLEGAIDVRVGSEHGTAGLLSGGRLELLLPASAPEIELTPHGFRPRLVAPSSAAITLSFTPE